MSLARLLSAIVVSSSLAATAAADQTGGLRLTAGLIDADLMAGEPAFAWIALANEHHETIRVMEPDLLLSLRIQASAGDVVDSCRPRVRCGGPILVPGIELEPGEVFTLIEPLAVRCSLAAGGQFEIRISWSSRVPEVVVGNQLRPSNWQGTLETNLTMQVNDAETPVDKLALSILELPDGRLEQFQLGKVLRDAPGSQAARWYQYEEYISVHARLKRRLEKQAQLPPEPYSALARLAEARCLLTAGQVAEAAALLEGAAALPEPLMRSTRKRLSEATSNKP